MNSKGISADITTLKALLSKIPKVWDGRQCIEEMKAREYNWRQTEWVGWYGQMIVEDLVRDSLTVPGKAYGIAEGKGKGTGKVEFDVFGSINWDIKVHPTKNDSSPLNDREATDLSISDHGAHGLIIINIDCVYDEDGEFKRWHDALKGRPSKYVAKNAARGARKRTRKVSGVVREILLIVLDQNGLAHLGGFQKGMRNSNDKPRREKYELSEKVLPNLRVEKIQF